MIRKYINRFPHAIRGIIYAALNDSSYRHQLYLTAVVIIGYLYFVTPLDKFEFLFVLLACVLILITELQNSAIEAALDRLHPELHESIKQSKDMASGAVLIAGLFLVTTLAVISYTRFII